MESELPVRFFHIPLGVPQTEEEVMERFDLISLALPDQYKILAKCYDDFKRTKCNKQAIKIFQKFKLKSYDLMILGISYDLNGDGISQIEKFLAKGGWGPEILDWTRDYIEFYEKPILRAKMAYMECLVYIIGSISILTLVEISDCYLGDPAFAQLLLELRILKNNDMGEATKNSKKVASSLPRILIGDSRKSKKAYKKYNTARQNNFILKHGISFLRNGKITIEDFEKGCNSLNIHLNQDDKNRLLGKKLKTKDMVLELLTKGGYINSESAFWDQCKLYGGLNSTQWVELYFLDIFGEDYFSAPLLKMPKIWKRLDLVTLIKDFGSVSLEIDSITKSFALDIFVGDEATDTNEPNQRRSSETFQVSPAP